MTWLGVFSFSHEGFYKYFRFKNASAMVGSTEGPYVGCHERCRSALAVGGWGPWGGEAISTPPPFNSSLGWCALRAPPFTRTVAPPPGPLARVDPGAGKRLARPGAPPTARPVTVGGRSSLEQHHPCQCNQGVRTAPSRVWSLATPCHRQ